MTETPELAIRKHAHGYVAEGPDFYIWDEDLSEVLRIAREIKTEDEIGLPAAQPLLDSAPESG